MKAGVVVENSAIKVETVNCPTSKEVEKRLKELSVFLSNELSKIPKKG